MPRDGKEARGGKERSRSRKRRKERRRERDKECPHFDWRPGEALGPSGRYVVQDLLGEGTFGRVLACTDSRTQAKVAVKVVKGVKRYCEHAEAEAEVLSQIQARDPKRQGLCVEMLDTFLHGRHNFCLVFEPLETNIRDLLKANRGRGLYMADAREMTRQLLQSLAFLHGIGVTHTDLKCRNVMLRHGAVDLAPHPRVGTAEARRPRSCEIVVVDFGGACFPDERHGGRVGTRQFRGPEVVLGLPWDETSDLWSAGCIIAMLYLGQRPFSVHEDMEHLAMMERLTGSELPRRMVKEATLDGELEGVFFRGDGRLAWPERAPEEEAIERVEDLEPLCDQVLKRHGSFLSLLQGLFEMDPRKRLPAAAGLRHPYITEAVVE